MDRLLAELALNFVERMKNAKMHDLEQLQIDKRALREHYMIEFMTGAYVGLRQAGKAAEARAVGHFTAEHLTSGNGYSLLCGLVRQEAPIVRASDAKRH